jgi:hypothetical protein
MGGHSFIADDGGLRFGYGALKRTAELLIDGVQRLGVEALSRGPAHQDGRPAIPDAADQAKVQRWSIVNINIPGYPYIYHW